MECRSVASVKRLRYENTQKQLKDIRVLIDQTYFTKVNMLLMFLTALFFEQLAILQVELRLYQSWENLHALFLAELELKNWS